MHLNLKVSSCRKKKALNFITLCIFRIYAPYCVRRRTVGLAVTYFFRNYLVKRQDLRGKYNWLEMFFL